MKKVLVVGSGNKDKLRELRVLLKGIRIRVIPVTHWKRLPRIVENGRTFEANASIKARAYSKRTGLLTLADDSGLCVRALRNAPGVYSARFAGPGCTYMDNNRKLLRLLDRPGKRREAYFVCSIAIYLNGKKIKLLKATCRGKVAHEAKGRNGFGYDPVFIPRGMNKTFGEMSPAIKNRISHRGKALKLTKRFLKTLKFNN